MRRFCLYCFLSTIYVSLIYHCTIIISQSLNLWDSFLVGLLVSHKIVTCLRSFSLKLSLVSQLIDCFSNCYLCRYSCMICNFFSRSSVSCCACVRPLLAYSHLILKTSFGFHLDLGSRFIWWLWIVIVLKLFVLFFGLSLIDLYFKYFPFASSICCLSLLKFGLLKFDCCLYPTPFDSLVCRWVLACLGWFTLCLQDISWIIVFTHSVSSWLVGLLIYFSFQVGFRLHLLWQCFSPFFYIPLFGLSKGGKQFSQRWKITL